MYRNNHDNHVPKRLLMAGVLGLASAVFAQTAVADPPPAAVSVAASDGDVVFLPAAATTSALPPTARTAFTFFVKKGLTPVQAAGVVGNLMQESNVNPRSNQGGGPGRGIAQWSEGARWDSLVAFARRRHASPLALGTQLQYLWHELSTIPNYGLGELRTAKSVPAATRVFEKRFEICGECNEPRRIELARTALRAYRGRAQRPNA
jgi:hypothetical protein